MDSRKRKVLSSDEALKEIERFVEDSESDEEDDLNELCDPDEFRQHIRDDLVGSVDESSAAEEQGNVGFEITESNVAEDEEDDTSHAKHPKRKLTKNKLVNSIDSALNEGNYRELILPENDEIHVGYLGSRKKKDTMTIQWSEKKPTIRGKQKHYDVITEKPGLKGALAKSADTPRKAFELFFTPDMQQIIVEMTNKRIDLYLEKLPDEIKESNKYSYLKRTNLIEVRAFIGLMYIRGLLGQNSLSAKILFANETGHPIFGATMSKDRFVFLTAHISFDDEETRNDRWKHDRFAAIRHLFESFNDNCSKHLVPSEYLTIDETLYPMRTQISFKQYNPDKPAKYGMLFKSLNDARYPFTYKSLVYAGKPEIIDDAPYFITGTENYVKSLVVRTEADVSLKGRNISMDRLYTSISTTQWLLSKGITSIGTMMSNRIGIPDAAKDIKHREPYSTRIFWEVENAELVLSSYCPSTAKGIKNVLLLSTVQPLLGVTKDDDKAKPAIYKLYDFTKGGTDVADLRIASSSAKPKSNRWSMVAFSYIIDETRVNANTVYAIGKGSVPSKMSSFGFAWELAKSLIIPQIEERPLNGLGKMTRLKIQLVLGDIHYKEKERPELDHPRQGAAAKKCHACIKEASGTEGYKKKKSNLPRIKTVCQGCGLSFCSHHLTQICDDCR